jgi:hypothetical protein
MQPDPLAQLGERLGDNQKVIGSSPIRITRTKACSKPTTGFLLYIKT